jgi:hypothetical protein
LRAVRFWLAAYVAGAVAPRPRPATPDVIDDAAVGSDLIALTADGAAFLVGQGRAPDCTDDAATVSQPEGAGVKAHPSTVTVQPTPLRRYEDLFPAEGDDPNGALIGTIVAGSI